jgi:TRAP transporter 4TM/12TM fusion protein
VSTVVLILEAGRRTVGWIFIVLTSVFLIYSYYGPYFPGIWGHEQFGFDFIFQTFYHSSNGIWGTMTGISATMLALFGIFSAVLSETGGAATFVQIGQNAVGNMIGGQGKVALVASGLFGMISGSAMANVMATGTFTIPLMRKAGYNKEWAAATSAVGSTGGQIMPPIMGAGAFIMAQLLGMSYLTIATAAIVPALLYYLGAFMSVHFISKRDNIRGDSENAAKVTPSQYLIIIIPIAVFLYYLMKRYTVDTAAFWASIAGYLFFLVVMAIKPRPKGQPNVGKRALSLGNKICVESAAAILSMASLLASAQLVITLIQLTGFGVKMSDLIVSIGQDSLFLCLVLSMIVCAILGMGLPTTAAYVLAAAVLVPPLIALGIVPFVAHLFVFYYSTLATITPPVCAAVFLSAGIAEANWLKTGILSCLIALPVFIIPYAFAYNQILLFNFTGHSAFEIVLAFVTALLGVVSIAMGVAGYSNRVLSLPVRAVAVLAGVLMTVPMVAPSLIGISIFAAVYMTTRAKASPSTLKA